MYSNTRRGRFRRAAPFWSAIVLVALAMSMVVLHCVQDRERRLQTAERDVEALAHIFSEHADRALQGVDLAVVAAQETLRGLDPASAADRAVAKRHLQRIAAGLSQVRLLVWVGPDGQALADSTPIENRIDFADRSFFVHHRDSTEPTPFLGEPVVGKRTGKTTINWSRRLERPDGSFAGLVVAGMEPDYFRNFYEAVRHEAEDWIAMFRLDGITLSRFPNSEEVGSPRSASSLFTTLIPRAARGTVRAHKGLSKGTRILSYRVSEMFPVVITASRPLATVENAWRRDAAEAVGLALLICSLALVCVRQLELRRRAMAAHAREVETNAASRARFVAVMSHEIRTPLNGILGFTELLLDGDLKAQEKRWATTIRDAGHLLRSIVNDVLDLAKIEAGKLTLHDAPFELRPVAASTLTLLRPLADVKKLELRTDFDPSLPDWVRGDEARLRQILINLVGNAIKFTGTGSVTLRARRINGTRIRFEIVDTGAGLTQSQIDALFAPFAQVGEVPSQRLAGTGLGLAISKELVEKMGGTIGIDSEPEEGSTFWFEIALPATAAAPPSVEAAPRPAAATSLRVLVADDVSTNQLLLRVLLERAGHRVELAADGVAAVRLARDRRFDLVLMDVEMPVMDGLQAARAIRDGGGPSSRAPIVAVTANVLPEQVAQCRDAGMNDCIAKPIDRDVLDRLLARLAAEKLPGAKPAAHDDARSVNRTLAELRAAIGVDPTRELVELSLAHLEQLCQRLDALSADPDAASVEAHAVTSIAGNVGLAELAAASRELHEELRQHHAASNVVWGRFNRAVKSGVEELAASAVA